MSLLSKIESGQKKKPLNIIVYGPEGVGKSTFASQTSDPVFLGAEENDELSVHRFPICKTWEEFVAGIDALYDEKHDFKTLVIDTLDSVEILLHRYILKNEPTDIMAKACGGYGAAYQKSTSEFVEVRRKLGKLRDERGMNIVILAHAQRVRSFNPEINIDVEYYEMKLHKSALPIFKDWVSAILFANFEVHSTKKDNREIAIGVGDRKMYTERRPGFEAKNRFNLPKIMKFDFNEFRQHVINFYNEGEK